MLITGVSEHLPVMQCDHTSVTCCLFSHPPPRGKSASGGVSCFDGVFICCFWGLLLNIPVALCLY